MCHEKLPINTTYCESSFRLKYISNNYSNFLTRIAKSVFKQIVSRGRCSYLLRMEIEIRVKQQFSFSEILPMPVHGLFYFSNPSFQFSNTNCFLYYFLIDCGSPYFIWFILFKFLFHTPL